MREPVWVRIAIWMIERGTPRGTGEALAGDLLEELHAGRSAGWFWGEVLLTLGQNVAKRVRPYAVALGFSVLWSAMFPYWFRGAWGRVLPAQMERWSALDWPYSSLLVVTGGLVPAVGCVFLGLGVYVLLVADGGGRPSGLRIVGSLSLGLNVLFVAVIALSAFGAGNVAEPHLTVQETMLLGAPQPVWTLPSATALWTAIVCAVRAPRVEGLHGSLPA